MIALQQLPELLRRVAEIERKLGPDDAQSTPDPGSASK